MCDTILETDRLLMRYQRHSDIATLVDIWADLKVTKYIGQPRERNFLLKEFEKTANDPTAEKFDLWVVIEKESGGIVGHCGFIDKHIEGKIEIDLTYIFSSAAWGNGYASEIASALKNHAFSKLGVIRVVALIHPRNTASANVAKKIGMKIEKQLIRPNDEIRDMYVVEKKDKE